MSREYYFGASFNEGNDSSPKLSPDNYESASENFLTDYEIVSNEDADSDEDVAKQLNAQSVKLQNFNPKLQFPKHNSECAKAKLYLSLSAEKIALKSQTNKKIDKSIVFKTEIETESGTRQQLHQRRERGTNTATKLAAATYCQRHKRAHQSRQHVPISFTIVPISEMAAKEQQQPQQSKNDGDLRNPPAIVLTPHGQQQQSQLFQQHDKTATAMVHTAPPNPPSSANHKALHKLVEIPPPLATFSFSTSKTKSEAITTMKTKAMANDPNNKPTMAPEVIATGKLEAHSICNSKPAKLSDDASTSQDLEDTSNSEITSQLGSSTSPESLMDNILSAASSVSVRSSSLSSGGTEMTKIKLVANNKRQQQRQYKNEDGVSDFGMIKGASGGNVDATDDGNEPHVAAKEINDNRTLNSKLSSSPHESLLLAATKPLSHQSITQPFTSSSACTLTPVSMLTAMSELQPPDLMEAHKYGSRSPSPSQQSSSLRVTPDPALLPEELKCVVCAEVYRDPRTLNCLHNFCFQCLVDENFKQDSSIPFWSHPSSQVDGSEWKATIKSNYSLRSSSPEMSMRSGSTSPSRQRQASFSFKRKKSLERLLLKSKSDGKSSDSSSSLRFNTASEQCTNSIICKICNFSTDVPIGGIRQLPQNTIITRKIDAIREKLGDEVIAKCWCSLCFDETNATYHCSTCTLNLCTLCKESHERQRNTASHKIRNIMELRRACKRQKVLQRDDSNFKLKCGMHPGFEMKSFCISCLQIACSDCLVLLHKGHKYEPIAKAYVNYGQVLRDAVDHARPLCNYTEHSIERLNEIAKRINKKCDDVQAEVETYMQQYFEAVEVHRKTLLQQVQRARESKVEMILEQQLDLERRKNESIEAVRFTQELIELGANVELLSFTNILLKRFEYCQQFKTPINAKISDSLSFLPEIRAPATKAQNDIPLYGIITMQTVEPSLCTLQWEGFSQLRLHKRVELLLQSRDADGVALCHGGLQIQALLKYKESNSKFLPMEISDNRDGTYGVAFTPDSQGTLLLAITIHNKPIKGNPFTFLARTVRPHSGIYHCCAFCSSKGNKLVKCFCEGRMPGYNGCGHGHAGHPGSRHWSCCGNVLENSECNVANKMLNS